MNKAIDKEAFLTADDLPLEWVPLPSKYGEDAGVYIRPMTGQERSDLEKKFAGGKGRENPGGFRLHVLLATVVDEEGKQLFSADDCKRLMTKNAATVETLFEAACKASGVMERDVEDMEGNSESGP